MSIPIELQLILLAVVGAVVGGQVNRGIYRLAWVPRAISPWSAPPTQVERRSLWSRLPIIGWFAVRAEAKEHGRGFWVRPLLIEVAFAAIYPLLYGWEIHGGLFTDAGLRLDPDPEALRAAFLLHASLLPLLVVATFIDFDEQTIPDAVTIPGTLLGLMLAAMIPAAGLPIAMHSIPAKTRQIETLVLTSPLDWDESLDGLQGLVIGLSCLGAWCLAIAPRLWTTRRGLRQGLRFLVASFLRSGWLRPLAALYVVGGAGIGTCWWLGGWHWHSLLSSLVGMAFGGGLVWLIRIIASSALGEEAMGFGDVTLMAMIGSFLGWQPSLLVFFLAPIAALFVSLAQWALTGRRDIAFGPYLCVAAVGVVGRWGRLWEGWGAGFFSLGWFVPAVLLFCMVMMAILLSIWGGIKRRFMTD